MRAAPSTIAKPSRSTLAIEEGDETEAEQWLSRSRVVQEAAGWSSDSFLALPFLC
jgi:hypothetical protein